MPMITILVHVQPLFRPAISDMYGQQTMIRLLLCRWKNTTRLKDSSWVLILVVMALFSNPATAQTCCSGGVPLSSNLGMPNVNKGSWQLSLNYDYNYLARLLAASEVLEDDSRIRSTHSLLLEVGWQISDRWAINAFVPTVRQERLLRPPGLPSTLQATNGLGDAVLMARYQPLEWLGLGLGAKLPTGSYQVRDERGIQYNADLQPGSGAWDGIGWLQASLPWAARPTGTWSFTAIGRYTGTNPTFRVGQSYTFGKDLQALIGYTERRFILKQLFDLSGMARFRLTGPDFAGGGAIANTGGWWLFLNPSVTWWIKRRFSYQMNMEVPLYSHVGGTQLSPSWRVNTGIYWLIERTRKIWYMPSI